MRENHGIFCSVVMFPMIPKGMILLRLIPTADHTEEDVEKTLEAFKSMKQKLDAGEYQKELEIIAQM
jgi:glycine C-acetyltransferase